MNTESVCEMVNLTGMVNHLRISWFLLERYRQLGCIPMPDAVQNGKPLWRACRIAEIAERIEATKKIERQKRNAKIRETWAQRKAEPVDVLSLLRS